VNLGMEGAMDRAFIGNLQKLGPLFLVQGPFQGDFAFDAIDPPFLRLASLAILGVDFLVFH
jgi:hypothetical protein